MATKKTWTVLFYIMAEPPSGVVLPVSSADYHRIINAEAQCVVSAATTAAIAHDMYAAIRVVWNHGAPGGNGIVQADIVGGPSPSPPPSIWSFFTPQRPRHSGPLVDDMAGFYEWALPACPAEHYAVFFWGHSFGPAGLFRVGSEIVVPGLNGGPPISGVPAVGASQVPLAELSRAAPLNIQGLHDALRTFPEKVDVVVFQDCWMSTLETAYQLRDVVATIVGSQSKVPIGVRPGEEDPGEADPCAGTWDYRTVFGDLDRPTQLVTHLHDFYNRRQPPANQLWNMWPNPSVPFAAMNLQAVDALTPPLKVIVHRLTDPAAPPLRAFPATTDPYITHFDTNGHLDAGSDTLADVARLLRGIEASWPASDHAMMDAAHRAQQALEQLVLISSEAYSTPTPLKFRGVSIVGGRKRLNGPATTKDGIRPLLHAWDYHNLELSKQTGWNHLVF